MIQEVERDYGHKKPISEMIVKNEHACIYWLARVEVKIKTKKSRGQEYIKNKK